MCALPAPTVQVTQAPYAPFGRYRTFTFEGSEGAPEGYAVTARSADVEQRMRALIGKELEQKGYVEVPEGGDFLVAYGAGSRTVTRTIRLSRPGVAVLGQNEEETSSVEGRLVVDVYDRVTRDVVWRSTATAEIGSSGIDEERLAETLGRMMVAFPARWRPAAGLRSAS